VKGRERTRIGHRWRKERKEKENKHDEEFGWKRRRGWRRRRRRRRRCINGYVSSECSLVDGEPHVNIVRRDSDSSSDHISSFSPTSTSTSFSSSTSTSFSSTSEVDDFVKVFVFLLLPNEVVS